MVKRLWKAIMQSFFRYADAENVKPDDRLIIFFAGHGHTVPGRRGETGFLVPVDGDPTDLSSLIRWDDFARNAELVPAKHILFLMDACYGGLLLSAPMFRGANTSSRRFSPLLKISCFLGAATRCTSTISRYCLRSFMRMYDQEVCLVFGALQVALHGRSADLFRIPFFPLLLRM